MAKPHTTNGLSNLDVVNFIGKTKKIKVTTQTTLLLKD
jgi:hypothetical protein